VSEQPNHAAGYAAPNEGRKMDILLLLGLFVLWIILQVWVLPKAGVPT
jgi:hypothetical protein